MSDLSKIYSTRKIGFDKNNDSVYMHYAKINEKIRIEVLRDRAVTIKSSEDFDQKKKPISLLYKSYISVPLSKELIISIANNPFYKINLKTILPRIWLLINDNSSIYHEIIRMIGSIDVSNTLSVQSRQYNIISTIDNKAIELSNKILSMINTGFEQIKKNGNTLGDYRIEVECVDILLKINNIFSLII
ncbi:MAG: hypothetical protein HQ510_04725 [Candidatus Marinimicrobia bacterium]|nr:hypothetical protein [Candidatus Neomarinimicrobiota bacterium]